MKKSQILGLTFASTLMLATTACAQMSVDLYSVNMQGKGEKIGTVSIESTDHGVVFAPNLKGLAPGVHGFHVHQNPSCEPAKKGEKVVPALAAGGHYDPKKTNKHDTPWGDGHLGDLPPLFVLEDGTSTQPVLAPRVKVSDLKGRALMIHAGGDNHSDHPKALGGGGARVACGVIK